MQNPASHRVEIACGDRLDPRDGLRPRPQQRGTLDPTHGTVQTQHLDGESDDPVRAHLPQLDRRRPLRCRLRQEGRQFGVRILARRLSQQVEVVRPGRLHPGRDALPRPHRPLEQIKGERAETPQQRVLAPHQLQRTDALHQGLVASVAVDAPIQLSTQRVHQPLGSIQFTGYTSDIGQPLQFGLVRYRLRKLPGRHTTLTPVHRGIDEEFVAPRAFLPVRPGRQYPCVGPDLFFGLVGGALGYRPIPGG